MRGPRILVALTATLSIIGAPGSTTDAGAAAGECTASVGFEGPITGPVAPLGREQLRFAQLAVSIDDAANGTNVALVPGDTQLAPAQAAALTGQFISNPSIVAVAGPAGSKEVQAVGPLFADAGMAFISGSATYSVLTSGANPTFFRVVPADRMQGPFDARFIIRKLHPRAVLLVDDRERYSTSLAAAMIPVLRRAHIRVDHESVPQSQTNFSQLVAKVTPSIGVVILPWQIAANAQKFGMALATHRSKAVIFGTDGLFSSAFTVTGSYVSDFAPDITAIRADTSIVQAARSRFGSFGTFGPPVYAATDVIAQAIAAVCRAGQQPTRATVLAEVRSINEPTSILGEPIRFTSTGELEGAHWFIFRIDRAARYRMLR
jgi:branched-chain amino acid transport system substrate-binding protein